MSNMEVLSRFFNFSLFVIPFCLHMELVVLWKERDALDTFLACLILLAFDALHLLFVFCVAKSVLLVWMESENRE